MSEKTQYFLGYKFTRGAENTYYRSAKLKKRMHVFVWEHYNGAIPDGYEIHHKDFDKSNNDISNLELLSIEAHRRLHAERLTSAERAWKRQNMNEKARPEAVKWHKSEAGSQWHSEHVKQQREAGAFQRTAICTNCGKEYVGEIKKLENHFCSNKCRAQFRRKAGLDLIETECVVCGKLYKTNKYRPAVTCSRSCGAKYQWSKK